MRLLIGVLVVLLTHTAAKAEDRNTIHIFRYSTTGEDEAAVFSNFAEVLRDKTPIFAEELLSTAGSLSDELVHELDMLNGLRVLIVKDGDPEDDSQVTDQMDLISSLEARQSYWRDIGALAVLTGRISTPETQSYVVRSNFFVGDYKNVLGRANFAVELPVTARNYDSTHDSHSVAILVTLALSVIYDESSSAVQNCLRRSTSYMLLDQADQRMKSVLLDNPSLGRELRQLVLATESGIRMLCP